MHDRNHRLSEITERRFGEDKISQHAKGSVILAFHPSAGEFSTSEEFFEATRLYRHEDTDIDGLRVMECAVYEDVPTNPQEIGCSHLFCYYCVQSNYKADPGFSCRRCRTSIPSVDTICPYRTVIS
uniref:RING-type domain-containing protein n=1 Tax=Magallana gigas TaxID=29159 RepID=A0A8W8JVT9_MAGGI